jgi:hypothetical protein
MTMADINPAAMCELLNGLLHASYRLTAADARNPRRTTTPRLEKRRAVDRLFLALFGRKATGAEHETIGTDSVSYGGY